MQLAEAPVKIQLRGVRTGGVGPDLTGYPQLTYAPGEWGEGVRSPATVPRRDTLHMMPSAPSPTSTGWHADMA